PLEVDQGEMRLQKGEILLTQSGQEPIAMMRIVRSNVSHRVDPVPNGDILPQWESGDASLVVMRRMNNGSNPSSTPLGWARDIRFGSARKSNAPTWSSV